MQTIQKLFSWYLNLICQLNHILHIHRTLKTQFNKSPDILPGNQRTSHVNFSFHPPIINNNISLKNDYLITNSLKYQLANRMKQ